MITGTRTYTLEELWYFRIKEGTMYTHVSSVWTSMIGGPFWFGVVRVTG